MHQIVCDKCQKTVPVVWTQMFVGWTTDSRRLSITAGGYLSIDRRQGEYLEQVGHGNLPIPEGWEYNWAYDDLPVQAEHLCPDCKTRDVPDSK